MANIRCVCPDCKTIVLANSMRKEGICESCKSHFDVANSAKVYEKYKQVITSIVERELDTVNPGVAIEKVNNAYGETGDFEKAMAMSRLLCNAFPEYPIVWLNKLDIETDSFEKMDVTDAEMETYLADYKQLTGLVKEETLNEVNAKWEIYLSKIRNHKSEIKQSLDQYKLENREIKGRVNNRRKYAMVLSIAACIYLLFLVAAVIFVEASGKLIWFFIGIALFIGMGVIIAMMAFSNQLKEQYASNKDIIQSLENEYRLLPNDSVLGGKITE